MAIETEEGKKVSGLNALRSGVTGQIDVTTPEEQEARDKFCGEIVSSLAPEPGIERQFAQSIAEDNWRLNRARSIENNIFTLACSFQDCTGESETPEIDKALGAARAFIADPKRFQLLTIYERRIHCSMQKRTNPLVIAAAPRDRSSSGGIRSTLKSVSALIRYAHRPRKTSIAHGCGRGISRALTSHIRAGSTGKRTDRR